MLGHLSKVGKALLAVLAVGATLDAAGAQPVPRKGGTAIVAIGAEPTAINPTITTSNPEATTGCMVYEGLTRVNMATGEPEPLLAESWTISPDRMTYTFKLRSNATWQDGKPVTSEDVRYTLMEVASKYSPTFVPQAGKVLLAVNTPDPQTVEVKLKEPFRPLLTLLTCSIGVGILPAHIFKGTDVLKNPANQRPVGSGPFMFSEWARGSHVKFVRNDKYWARGKPYLDSLVVRFLPNAGARVQALLAGEVDFISRSQFPASGIAAVEASPGAKRELTGFTPTQMFAYFNLKRKPLDDPRVRHALLTASDRKYILDNVFHGEGRVGSAPWSKEITWASDPAIDYDKSHPFSPEKAARMLDEAGYKPDASGVRFRLSITFDGASAERLQTATALKDMWRRAGVEVTVLPGELAVLLPKVHEQGDFDVYLVGYNSYGDPAIGLSKAYTTSNIGVRLGNAAGYSNPEVDALFEKAAKLPTEEARPVYGELQRILMRDLPAIIVHEYRGYDAASKSLKDAWGWMGSGIWANAWIDR